MPEVVRADPGRVDTAHGRRSGKEAPALSEGGTGRLPGTGIALSTGNPACGIAVTMVM
jgi:hypothetical protein